MSILFRNVSAVTHSDRGELEAVDILVDGDTIIEVGADLDAPGADVVDGAGKVAIPGMADTHTHLWEALFRGRVSNAWGMEYFTNIPPLGSHVTPDDMYAGVYAGAVELLANGVTSVLDYCHAILTPEHADAALKGLEDAGIRAILGYDLAGRDPGGRATLGPSAARFDDIRRMGGVIDKSDRSLVRLGVCVNTINAGNVDNVVNEIQFARSIGAPMSFHNNRGGELVLLARHGMLDQDILPAHCNYTTDEDLDALAEVGGSISTQPEAETYAGRRPYSMVGRAHERGVRIALGVDVPGLVSSAIMTQMRLLYFLQRYMDGVEERAEAQVPIARRPGWPRLHSDDVLRFGTVDGVGAMGLDGVVGRIEPGFKADLVLLDASTFGISESGLSNHVVMNSTPADVHTVMVGGEFRKRDGKLVGVDVESTLRNRVEARDRVYQSAGVEPGEWSETWWDWVERG